MINHEKEFIKKLKTYLENDISGFGSVYPSLSLILPCPVFPENKPISSKTIVISGD